MMFWYVLTGIFAGAMSGMLGLGGGIFVVPALAALFSYNPDISIELHMRMAIGTSLAIMIVTLASSLYAHHKRRTVNWLMVKTIFPGLFVGIMIGMLLVYVLPSSFLSRIFSVFLLFLIVHMLFFEHDSPEEYSSKTISPALITGFSALIGVLSGLLGVGGGTMWVPFFLYCKLQMRDAVGTSVACGMIVAVIATAGFISAGFFTDFYVPYSTSYIYWPAFLGVSMLLPKLNKLILTYSGDHPLPEYQSYQQPQRADIQQTFNPQPPPPPYATRAGGIEPPAVEVKNEPPPPYPENKQNAFSFRRWAQSLFQNAQPAQQPVVNNPPLQQPSSPQQEQQRQQPPTQNLSNSNLRPQQNLDLLTPFQHQQQPDNRRRLDPNRPFDVQQQGRDDKEPPRRGPR